MEMLLKRVVLFYDRTGCEQKNCITGFICSENVECGDMAECFCDENKYGRI